jgi:hypothetical protein
MSGWQQVQHYSDHRGNPVVLEQYVEPGFEPDPVHLVPIQVYSTVPLDENHEQLRLYLLNTFWDEEVKPLFEIYSYRPTDAYGCIDHNRREIAHRKQQHASGATNPPPLIPQFFDERYENPIGCCILLRSHSYRLGLVGDPDEYAAAGEAPDWVYFTRTFSSTRTSVDPVQRLPAADADPDDEDQLYPEAFESTIDHVRNQADIGQQIMQEIFGNACGFGEDQNSLHYAMDVDEGSPPDASLPSETEIRQQLDQEVANGDYTLDSAFQVSHNAGSVTVTNTPEGAEADIQYLIYPSFLSHLGDQSTVPTLLESTARLFTSALKSHLSTSKTLNLAFHIPDSSPVLWRTLRPAHNAALSAHGPTPFALGALHTIAANNDAPARHRVSPQRREDTLATARISISRTYRVFAVVLDRPAFVSEAGVFFFMHDYDSVNDPAPEYPDCPDTEVWRSAGIREVARRLGMLVVEEAG